MLGTGFRLDRRLPSMQKKITYILLFCLSMGQAFPLNEGTFLCFKKNGSVSVEVDQHCCHAHDDHASDHTQKAQPKRGDDNCLSRTHTQCCIDVPLSHTELDTLKTDVARGDQLRAVRSTGFLTDTASSPLVNPLRRYALPLPGHSPPTTTIVLLI